MILIVCIKSVSKAFTDLMGCINIKTPAPGDTAQSTALVVLQDYTPGHTTGVADHAGKPAYVTVQLNYNAPLCLGISATYILRHKSKYVHQILQGFYHIADNAFTKTNPITFQHIAADLTARAHLDFCARATLLEAAARLLPD